MVKAIVLRAAGTNCDYETAFALGEAGFKVEAVHINSLVRGEKKLNDYSLLAIPGGFSYGDYLGSGRLFANKLLYKLNSNIPKFIDAGNLAIGICNGFQVMVRAGILPGFAGSYTKQECTLTFNRSGRFQCEWVKLIKKEKTRCIFTKGISELAAPIAHGEGRFLPAGSEVLRKLYENSQVVFKYENNPNGSVDSIAGICDETGRIFGMMPHPERSLFPESAPDGKSGGLGRKIFENAFSYLKK